MANNRLWLLNERRKDLFFLGKSFGEGWDLRFKVEDLEDWLKWDIEAAVSGGESQVIVVTEHHPLFSEREWWKEYTTTWSGAPPDG